jgi:protein TonB
MPQKHRRGVTLRAVRDALTPVPVTNVSAGHLCLEVDAARTADVPFDFERQGERMGRAAIASFASHACAMLLAVFALRHAGGGATSAPVLPFHPGPRIVWLNDPGPGGGGGGGGNRMIAPPRSAEARGKDTVTVPVERPSKLAAPNEDAPEPDPTEQLNIPAKSLANATASLPGMIETPAAPPTLSQGSGTGRGAGTGTGSGLRSGTGAGLGPGRDGGTGGDAYRPGDGVTLPRVLHDERPQYTSDAMRAKVQGAVVVECVVLADGSVGDVRVVRSLDPTFGLDQQAVAAAHKWRFTPGTRLGQPVAVLVTIELTFTLR